MTMRCLNSGENLILVSCKDEKNGRVFRLAGKQHIYLEEPVLVLSLGFHPMTFFGIDATLEVFLFSEKTVIRDIDFQKISLSCRLQKIHNLKP